MNNKRLTFYFISLLVLLSLYMIFVNAVAPANTLQQIVVTNVSSNGANANQYNITTGKSLNITCEAQGFSIEAAFANITLFHNFNGSVNDKIQINQTNGTGSSSSVSHSVLSQNASLTTLSVRFSVFNGSTVTYDVNGAYTGNYAQADGNFTVGCQAGLNVTVDTTNASFTLGHLRNFSSNRTITIDRTRPTFTVSTLNISDGTNTLTLSDLNISSGGYLRNNTDLVVKVTVNEPHLSSARLYWTTNGSPITGLVTGGSLTEGGNNLNNLTMDNQHSPFSSNNNTVLNGSLRYAGKAANGSGSGAIVDRLSTLAEGTVINFILVANDSAGNIVNFTNGGKGFNITLDGTAPGATLSLDKTRVAVENALVASCDSNDTSPVKLTITLTKPSGATVIKEQSGGQLFKPSFSGKETGEAGKYTVKCESEDAVKFSSKTEKEFSAYYEAEDEASIEEEVTERKVAEVDLSRSVDGTAPEGTITGIQGESTTFTLDGETEHTLTFLQVTATSSTIRIESTPTDITLNLRESREVDLDGDGDNDVIVRLDAIEDEEARVTIKPVKIPPRVVEEPTPTTTPTETEKPSRAGVTIVVLLILAVVVAAYFLLKGKGKKKKGEIRFTSKDLSSEFKF